MPEGPEVRRAADRIEKAVLGKPITVIDIDHPALEGAERWLYGAVLQRVQTFYLVLCVARGTNKKVQLCLGIQGFFLQASEF